MIVFHKSIRWRLQAWHSLVLLIVLAAFGVTAYRLVRENHLKRVDAELQRRMTIVIAAVGPRPRPAPLGPRPGIAFRLSPEQQAFFDDAGLGSFYYVVWLSDGQMRRSSSNAPPGISMPEIKSTPSSGTLRARGEFRELTVAIPRNLPFGSRSTNDVFLRAVAVVGCSITTTLDELDHLAWGFSAAGGGVLLLGLLTGWWLSATAIKPISAISVTAKSIARGNLSERIELADTENELGELARVLNETFDRLQSAYRRQAQFTADASHELRTPAFVILAQAQSALKRERTPAEYRNGFEVCQRAAQQMRGLIEALLILARQDAGESKPVCQPCSLEAIAGEAVDLLRPLAFERNVSIHSEFKSVTISGDTQQLRQVAVNLLSNAIQYNKLGGSVKVIVTDENGYAVLTVRDTGPGIPADDLPHIFARFYRVDKSRASTGEHAGLGLAICKAIVQAHGGAMEVFSQVGEGTVFTARFPLMQTA
ncbi:MAG: HAMP domain-containing protein [Pedosphaera sp.]|nr:HAMP domain-containing protein [Pedosphaera sp.]